MVVKIKGELKMIILVLIFTTFYLYSQVNVSKSELELTHFQINQMQEVNDYLFLLTQFENNVAIDKFDLNTNQIYNDFLTEKDFKVSAEATLFKSKDGN